MKHPKVMGTDNLSILYTTSQPNLLIYILKTENVALIKSKARFCHQGSGNDIFPPGCISQRYPCQITKAIFNQEQLYIKCNVHSRFSNTSLLCPFGASSVCPICFTCDEELKFAREEVLEILTDLYGQE